MQKIGVTDTVGFSSRELKEAQDIISDKFPHVKTELIDLHDYLPKGYSDV